MFAKNSHALQSCTMTGISMALTVHSVADKWPVMFHTPVHWPRLPLTEHEETEHRQLCGIVSYTISLTSSSCCSHTAANPAKSLISSILTRILTCDGFRLRISMSARCRAPCFLVRDLFYGAMDGVELARRKALQVAVAALCVEIGFVSADKDAMGTLSEILQSCKQFCGMYL